MAGEQKKNVILGLIAGYDFEVLRPFVSTLRDTGYADDLVLFYCDIDVQSQEQLRAFGATLIPFSRIYPYQENRALPLAWQHNPRLQQLTVYCLRYLLAYWFLIEHYEKYANVMLTDVRDVLFQKDPFDFAIDDHLCCFVERTGMAIRDSKINTEWIEVGFGKKALELLSDKPIACSGTTIGSLRAVQSYLSQFLDTIVSRDVPADRRGMDQGIHNYLLHTGALPDAILFSNDTGPVLTLGLEDTVHLNTAGLIVQKNNTIPNTVHQYDRHWNIAKRYYSPALRRRFIVDRWRGRVARLLTPFPVIHHGLRSTRDILLRRNQ